MYHILIQFQHYEEKVTLVYKDIVVVEVGGMDFFIFRGWWWKVVGGREGQGRIVFFWNLTLFYIQFKNTQLNESYKTKDSRTSKKICLPMQKENSLFGILSHSSFETVLFQFLLWKKSFSRPGGTYGDGWNLSQQGQSHWLWRICQQSRKDRIHLSFRILDIYFLLAFLL